MCNFSPHGDNYIELILCFYFIKASLVNRGYLLRQILFTYVTCTHVKSRCVEYTCTFDSPVPRDK